MLHPAYYRCIYKYGLSKFARFAENVWGIARGGRSDDELASAGIDALADFIKEIGLPSTLGELGITDKKLLKEIAETCAVSAGGYKRLNAKEIYNIFISCLK